MVSSKATTVKDYLAELPPERKKAIEGVRKVIRKHLPKGYKEGMQYGMISYFIPLSRYPDTYNGQPLAIAGIASQKSYMSLYLMGCYAVDKHRAWLEKAWKASGKKLEMGKSCVRFKSLDDVALEVVGDAIARIDVDEYIAAAEAAHPKKKKRSRT